MINNNIFINLLFIILFSLVFSFLLLLVTFLCSTKLQDIFKIKSYECGFKNFDHNARQNPSLQFFFIGILFLLFDLEAILLYP
jgi:NADH:ubiquinone oxidoreductase subunit 3 (subunit A)